MYVSAFGPGFIRSMSEWVEEQKVLLKLAKKAEFKDADRLTLMLAARTACNHIMRTIKGFDNWLQNPAIVSVMPEEMLREVQSKLWDIMLRLIEFDVKHTSEFVEYVSKKGGEEIPRLLMRTERKVRAREELPPRSL